MPRDEKSNSIWKKEISFRRKPEIDSSAASDAEGGSSIWKKEIGLSRKKATAPDAQSEFSTDPEPLVAEADAELVAEPETTFEPVAALEEPAVALTPVAVEHDWLTQPLEEVSDPPSQEPEPEPEPEPAPATITLVPAVELPAPVAVPDLEPETEAEPDLELPPVAEEATRAFLESPAKEILTHEQPTVELPAVELPTDNLAEDVPAVETPVVETPAGDKVAKQPFYKKELSLKRKPRERTPKAERPKRERPLRKRTKEKTEAASKPEAGEQVPFYKRGISLKRSPAQWDAAEPAAPSRPKLRRVPRPRPSLPRNNRGAKTIVGLKIGGSQIAAARVSNNGSPELVQAVREPLEQGIVVGGELRDPEALAVALKDFFTRNNLPKRGVRLGIANNRIGVRTFDVVGINDPKQLANAIRFRAQEVLPIPIEEAVLDYQVLSEWVNEEGQPVRRVLLVVAYRELVDRYVYACRKAGIQVVGIDLEAFALLRAVSVPHDPVPGAERVAVVAVSVGHDRSTFAVSDGRVCEFTRVLEWGGWSLNIAIARALDISPSEAEPIKRALSLNGGEEEPEGFSADQIATAREAARRQLQSFARELVSSLQFYQNQPGSLGIGEIALTGGTAHLLGLGAELERLIGVPVRVADPLARVKVSKKVRDSAQFGSLAIAIGLGIED
ncbi:MAG: type IV pilus assembly protein PilM [Gaiellaceae bacterium]